MTAGIAKDILDRSRDLAARRAFWAREALGPIANQDSLARHDGQKPIQALKIGAAVGDSDSRKIFSRRSFLEIALEERRVKLSARDISQDNNANALLSTGTRLFAALALLAFAPLFLKIANVGEPCRAAVNGDFPGDGPAPRVPAERKGGNK
jgi:hypothetical protein